jgi:hypothetical protein
MTPVSTVSTADQDDGDSASQRSQAVVAQLTHTRHMHALAHIGTQMAAVEGQVTLHTRFHT